MLESSYTKRENNTEKVMGVTMQNQQHSRFKNVLYDVLCFILGSFLYGISVSVFSEPNQLAPGGVTGLSILFNALFATPVGITALVLNLPLIVWATLELGYRLVLKTATAIVLTSVAIDIVALILPTYCGDKMLVAIFAGVTEGAGLALIFMRGGTTGGTDTAARLLGKRFPHVSMGRLMMLIDLCVVTVSAVVFGSIESAMYAVIVIFVATRIIDAVLYGTDVGTGKMLFIMSQKSAQIAQAVISQMVRGVTLLQSQGAYTGKQGQVLLCAVRRYEVYRLMRLVKEIDHDAFVIIGDAGQINGEGFAANGEEIETLRMLLRRKRQHRGR